MFFAFYLQYQKKKVSTHRILLSSNKEKRSTPRLTYGEVIQHILTSASDSVEENPFNSNETPLVEVVTNSKDRRVLLHLFLFSKRYF